jgi:hypothetical protein
MIHSRVAVIEAREFNSPPSLAHDDRTTHRKTFAQAGAKKQMPASKNAGISPLLAAQALGPPGFTC